MIKGLESTSELQLKTFVRNEFFDGFDNNINRLYTEFTSIFIAKQIPDNIADSINKHMLQLVEIGIYKAFLTIRPRRKSDFVITQYGINWLEREAACFIASKVSLQDFVYNHDIVTNIIKGHHDFDNMIMQCVSVGTV